jgi:anti-sigma B factor antagonist
MRITTSHSEGAVTVRVHATRLDAAVADELRRGLGEAIAAGASVPMVVDLRDVTFMDSAGLGALVGSLKTASTRDISISGAQPAVLTVLRMTRVDRSIRVLPAAP